MILEQRKLLKKKRFQIKKNVLLVTESTFFESSEFEIPLEEILVKKIVKQTTTGILPILGFLFFSFMFTLFLLFKIFSDVKVESGVLVFMFMLSAVAFIFAYISRKKSILIPTINNRIIEVYQNRPKKLVTNEFIENLRLKVVEYLKNKYAQIDKDLPIEGQLENIIWLKNNDILNEEEFQKLKTELISFRKLNAAIGFNK